MDNENDKTLFEVKINETSKKLILKIYPLVFLGFIATVFLSAILIWISSYSISKYGRTAGGSIQQWHFFLSPFYSIFYSILGIIGGYFYFLSIKLMKKAATNSDETIFNLAFKYLYFNTILFTITIFISLLFGVLQVIVILS